MKLFKPTSCKENPDFPSQLLNSINEKLDTNNVVQTGRLSPKTEDNNQQLRLKFIGFSDSKIQTEASYAWQKCSGQHYSLPGVRNWIFTENFDRKKLFTNAIDKSCIHIRNLKLFVNEQKNTPQSLSAENIEVLSGLGIISFQKRLSLTSLVSQSLPGILCITETL